MLLVYDVIGHSLPSLEW